MNGLDYWDGLLIGVAALVAVSTLTKLMRARRNLLIRQVRDQLAAEQERRRLAEKKRKKKEREQAA